MKQALSWGKLSLVHGDRRAEKIVNDLQSKIDLLGPSYDDEDIFDHPKTKSVLDVFVRVSNLLPPTSAVAPHPAPSLLEFEEIVEDYPFADSLIPEECLH